MSRLRCVVLAACLAAAACAKEATGPKPAAYVDIAAGQYHACALTTTGAAQCWGYDYNGDLGYGKFRDTSNVPRAVSGGLAFASVGAGFEFSCGLGSQGAAYCWGMDDASRLGDSSMSDRAVPGPVLGGLTFASLSVGAGTSCGLTAAGAAYCWGTNEMLEAGSPANVAYVPAPSAAGGGMTFTTISTGYEVTCGLTSAGAAWCWGGNEYGELGVDSTTPFSSTPVAVSGGLTFRSITAGVARACGVTPAGKVYCWGLRMGGDYQADAYAPVLVPSTQVFASVSPGLGVHSCALTTAGAAYCWGPNDRGELGTTTAYGGCAISPCSSVPVPVAGGLTFSRIVTGGNGFTCGLTTGHEAYCWGANDLGELGDGSFVDAAVPTRVAGPGS